MRLAACGEDQQCGEGPPQLEPEFDEVLLIEDGGGQFWSELIWRYRRSYTMGDTIGNLNRISAASIRSMCIETS